MADGIYSAVPSALRETRLTLKDIMTDIAATTAQDAKLKLALDSQRGSLEIEKLQGEADLATIASDRDFRERELTEKTRHQKAMEGIADPQAEVFKSSNTMRNWILKYPGMASSMKDLAIQNLPDEELDQTMTGYEARMLYDSISKNPGFYYRNLKGLVIDKLEGMMEQYNDPNIDEAGREEINQQYQPLHKHLQKLDTILGAGVEITDKELKELREMAVEYASESDGTISVSDAMNEILESTKQVRGGVYGGKIFPKSLKELLGKGGAPGEAGEDQLDFRKYKPTKKGTALQRTGLKDIAELPPVDLPF